MKHTAAGLVFVSVCGIFVSSASASVLFEDVFYWVPGGPGPFDVSVQVNPANPPSNAWVKIQETVFDDVQGRQVLQDNITAGTIHGSLMPGVPFDLYVYSITNLTYGNGPVTGGGNGVSGFNIVNQFNVQNLGQWGPTASSSWWDTPAGNTPFPANFEWDVDGNMNGADGDGFGILLGNTFNGFMFAVPANTPHGILPAWVHSWSGGGAMEQPNSFQIDVTSGGFLSGPIPTPGAISLMLVASIMVVRRRR